MKRRTLFAILAMVGLVTAQAQDITVSSNADWKAFIGSTSANANANVKLAADITIDDYFRGTFSGTLDGQGHTITLPENLTQDFAPIGTAGAGAVFKNLNIVGDVNTNKQLCGVAWKVAGATTFENVHVKTSVYSTNTLTAGFVVNCDANVNFIGCTSDVNITNKFNNMEANSSAFICKVNKGITYNFKDCAAYGSITVDWGWRAGGYVSSEYAVCEAVFENCIQACDIIQNNGSLRVGGFVGSPYNNSSKYTFKNCLVTGKVKRSDNHDGNYVNDPSLLAIGFSTPDVINVTNCYFTSATGGNTIGKAAFQYAADEQVASGALCYTLNGDQTKIGFYQNIGEDAAPVLDSTHKQVFASGRKHCDGTDYAGVTYNNVSGETTQDEHNFVNDVCTYCQEIVVSDDGYFHIKDANGWAGFAKKLSAGVLDLNVKLETDLSVTQMLASGYRGTFDGQGHTLDINIGAATGKYSIFNTIGAATVKNLIVTGQVTGESNTAPIACYAGANVTLENVITNVTMTQTTLNDGNCSGMIGCANANITFRNCVVAGLIKAKKDAGGFVGWGASRTFTMDNCAMIGDVTTEQGAKSIFLRVQANSNKYNITNTYYKPCTPTIQCGNGSEMAAKAQTIAAEDIASGALTYMLNGDQSKINFFQTLGEDNIPTINTTHKQVYAEGKKHCDGTDYPGITYNNVAENIIKDDHDYADNVCTNCGDLVLEDGYFHITNPARWTAFANKQKAGVTNINVKLDDDITVTEPLRNMYEGIFDGQGHTITADINLPTWDIVGIFQQTNNATLKNLRVDGSVVGNNSTGAFVGIANGKTNFQNVVSSALVTGRNNVGGFAGNCGATGPQTWTNCLWDGKVKTTYNGAGGYVGWASDNKMTARNCVAVGEIEGKQIAYMFRVKCKGSLGNDPGAAGCYVDAQNIFILKRGCIDTEDGVNKEALGNGTPNWWGEFLIDETINPTAEELASGKITYALNGGNTTNPVWRQTIKVDDVPDMKASSAVVEYVGDAGYASFYDADEDYELNGAEAYIGTKVGDYVSLTKVADIPAGTPVILKGAYYNKVVTSASANTAANDLQASADAVVANGTQYILGKVDDTVGFYKANGTIPAGKVYLVSASEIKGFVFGDDATGIELTTDNGQQTTEIFNLSGQRLNKAQKGVNIMNGKKVMY